MERNNILKSNNLLTYSRLCGKMLEVCVSQTKDKERERQNEKIQVNYADHACACYDHFLLCFLRI